VDTLGGAAHPRGSKNPDEGETMTDSVYKVIELVGTSSESWEKAAAAAVALASQSLRDLRIAEVKERDVAIEDGRITTYRAKLSVSFKYEGGG
jgi:flavin-binding protein dodecin